MTWVHMMAQAESVLKPSLAMHLACGHLTGIVKEDKDLVPKLTKECYKVCQKSCCRTCHASAETISYHHFGFSVL